MEICWYCYWGWSAPVYLIYQEALRRLNGHESPLNYGPAHIVWADENWDSVDFCLENFDRYKGNYTDQELGIVRWSLEELAKLPLAVREIQPEDYDGINPDLYPPTVEVIKRR